MLDGQEAGGNQGQTLPDAKTTPNSARDRLSRTPSPYRENDLSSDARYGAATSVFQNRTALRNHNVS